MTTATKIADALRPLAPGNELHTPEVPLINQIAALWESRAPSAPAQLDHSALFAALRARGGLFAGGLTQPQVDGISATLRATAKHALPLAWLAYVLATEQHETGGKMSPNRESLNYSVEGLLKQFGRHRISAADARRLGRVGTVPLSEARQREIANLVYGGEWGREELGNTKPDDGWTYRGGGKDHCTGRTNYAKVDSALGFDGALLADPDLILRGDMAAEAIVTGMVLGRYTGRKLADFLPATGTASLKQFIAARPIINGTDRAEHIAGLAMQWQAALRAGGRES